MIWMGLGMIGIGWDDRLDMPVFLIFLDFFGDFVVFEYAAKIDHYLETSFSGKKNPTICRVEISANFFFFGRNFFFREFI